MKARDVLLESLPPAAGGQARRETASTRDRHATWYINYLKDRKNAPLSVIVDANTGAVEKVVKT